MAAIYITNILRNNI